MVVVVVPYPDARSSDGEDLRLAEVVARVEPYDSVAVCVSEVPPPLARVMLSRLPWAYFADANAAGVDRDLLVATPTPACRRCSPAASRPRRPRPAPRNRRIVPLTKSLDSMGVADGARVYDVEVFTVCVRPAILYSAVPPRGCVHSAA